MVNIRQKGHGAERDVALALNAIIDEMLTGAGIALPDRPICQRNQMQSAVGGCDLVGTFGVAIEVKRQEALSINSWWKQTEAAADRNCEIPVLLYRQSRQPWKCIMYMWADESGCGDLSKLSRSRAEISWDDFLKWFGSHVAECISKGWIPKV